MSYEKHIGSSFGVVEGVLIETMDSEHKSVLCIYDRLSRNCVRCNPLDDVEDQVYDLLAARVQAFGLIHYTKEGYQKSIEVQKFKKLHHYPRGASLGPFKGVLR